MVDNLLKKETVEHIQTNFLTYTNYCPCYTLIAEAVNEHEKNCPCAVHWFFETDPICMELGKDTSDISSIMGDLCDIYRYIKHLTMASKKEFLKGNSNKNFLCLI